MEHEIPAGNRVESCAEVVCTKCGFMTREFRAERWVCDCVFTRVGAVLKKSARIKSWMDVMEKLTRLYCLNKLETESGFEADDEILERAEDYVLIRDSQGLLLIVLHDEESHDFIDKAREKTKPAKTVVVFAF
jgi:hypothetical protein